MLLCNLLISFLLLFSVNYGFGAEVRLLHLNDFHGHIEANQTSDSTGLLGGIDTLASRIESLRQEKPSLLLAAGDMIQGSAWANLSQGESIIEIMNYLKFDAMVLGNHEFDFGKEILGRRIGEAKFPVLAANLQGFPQVCSYIKREINGVKLGIIGVLTEDTPVTTHPKNVVGLTVTDPKAAVAGIVSLLRNEVDVIVVLSHIGHQADRSLAESVQGIDLIIGGHTHTRIESPEKVGKTYITQAWEHGKVLGVVDIRTDNGKIIAISPRLESVLAGDAGLQAIVDKYTSRFNGVMDKVVFTSEVELRGDNARYQESVLGNLLTDIMRKEAHSDVAVINGGAIRGNLPKGKVRVKDIYNALPFDNYTLALKLTGRQILETLEHGLSGLDNREGKFLQVSGLSFRYNPVLPPGKQVSDILVNGKSINMEKTYSVATNDFLASGGDGFTAFRQAINSTNDLIVNGGALISKSIVFSNSSRWLRDLFMEHLANGPVERGVYGRIIVTN